MRAGLISFAGNATVKFPYDIIMKTCIIQTNATVATRSLAVAGSTATGSTAAASLNFGDLLASITPTTGVTSRVTELAVPANTAITITNGVAGDTALMTYVALP